MDRVKKIIKQTSNKFLNLYELEAERRNGKISPYYMASRAYEVEKLKISTGKNNADCVAIYGIYDNKVVLVRQYRYPIDGYIYEFPAGIIEKGEDMVSAAVREMQEETGLTLTPINSGSYSRPFFTSVGMSDETCGTVYGYLAGNPTNINQEDSEDIEVVLADREECKRILKDERVAIMCAYMLMHFIDSDDKPFAFLNKK
ncbi:MAG: NUDIX hydrolase [Lachnospiraceae bacterium]|nr:NUDIX hydrolase [Lachnospiraceae bacterium]